MLEFPYDPTTYYLFHWSQKVIDFAEKKNINIIDLQGERANKKEFTNIVVKRRPYLVLFNGHGTKDSIDGHNNETLIKAGENEDLLKNKIIYALSCETAKLFLEPSNQITISLLKGHTTGDSHQRSQNSFLKNIQKLLSSESAETYLARFLVWDMRHQVCLGNREASLNDF